MGSAAKILAVGDDRTYLKRLKKNIESKKGWRVVAACDGGDAMEKLGTEGFDLVLVDAKMAGMGGYEVCSKIKHNEKFQHIPVMLLTAVRQNVQQKIDGLKIGADDFVSKRASAEELTARISAFLRSKRLYDKLQESEEALNAKVSELTRVNMELKNTQEELFHLSKLSILGQVAAEMAHEINNPLLIIKLYVEEMTSEIEFGAFRAAEGRKWLAIMAKSCEAIALAVNHLRNFCRQSEETFSKMDINDALKSALIIIKLPFEKQGITITEELSDEKLEFYGNENKIEQVLANLLFNARDSFAGHGGAEKNIVIRTGAKNSSVYVEIRDNGCGMDDDTKEKLFAPFFTTKPNGIGLGLSIVKRIIDEHSGKIEIESRPGKGTGIMIVFPRDRRRQERS